LNFGKEDLQKPPRRKGILKFGVCGACRVVRFRFSSGAVLPSPVLALLRVKTTFKTNKRFLFDFYTLLLPAF
jgi:hypothetical protein